MNHLMEFNDGVTLIRDGKEIQIRAYVQSQKAVFAEFGVDAEEGDEFRSDALPGEFVVKAVNRTRGPNASYSDLNHAKLILVTKKEWLRTQEKQGLPVSQVWNIGTAGAVAGRDMHSVNVIMSQLVQKIEEAIKNDPAIPEEKKKGMLHKIGDAVLNPRVIEAAVAVLKGIFA
jgi:hypothetical protein